MGAGGGSGEQTTTTHQGSHLPNWEQPIAKAYLSALAGLIFPGMTMPSKFMPKGWNFGDNGPSNVPGGGSSGAGSNSGSGIGGGATAGIDPALVSQFLDPAIGGSAYLQNQAAQNPAAIQGAASPAAFNQLASIYGQMGGGGKSAKEAKQ